LSFGLPFSALPISLLSFPSSFVLLLASFVCINRGEFSLSRGGDVWNGSCLEPVFRVVLAFVWSRWLGGVHRSWRMWRRGFFGGGGESRVVLGLLSCSCCCCLSFLTHPRLIIFYYIFIHPLPFLLVVMVRCGSFSEEGYYIKFIIPFK
jgi:hypothetical protein